MRSIVVPVDGSSLAECALMPAVGISQARRRALAYLLRIAGRLEERGVSADARVLARAHAGHVVTDCADLIDADLVAVATRERGAARRAALGSVADAAVRRGACADPDLSLADEAAGDIRPEAPPPGTRGVMRIRRAVAASLVIALGGGCGSQAPEGPVPVEGSRAAVDSLSGDWEGTYRASGASRHGIIRFSLRPGADTAHGEVEITFARAQRLYGDQPEETLPRTPRRLLDIALVRTDGGTVRGTLAPYWDPDCECQTVAVFEGRLAGPDRVEGTFSSRRAPDGPVLLSGHWMAGRR